MRHRSTRVFGWLVCGLVVASVQAAGFTALDLTARIAAADRIVVGVVDAVRVEERSGEPWSIITLRVERWFVSDGNALPADAAGGRPESVEAAFWGGTLPDGRYLQVAGMPTFALGERVLWMLRESTPGLAAPSVGVTQGVWRAGASGWRGDDGGLLSLDEDGNLTLTGPGAPDELVFEALASRIAEVLR